MYIKQPEFSMSHNLIFTAFSVADAFGKCIFLGLFALSILSWIVLIQKIWLLRKIEQVSVGYMRETKKQSATIFQNLPKTDGDIPNPFAAMLTSLKERTKELLEKNKFFTKTDSVYLTGHDLNALESNAKIEIKTQVQFLEKNLFILPTIVTLAPFLGLLGTVWGILIAFSELQSGGTLGSSTALIGGLSTALMTTVIGLLIAIPALVAHNYIKNKIKRMRESMENFAMQLTSNIELHYKRVE